MFHTCFPAVRKHSALQIEFGSPLGYIFENLFDDVFSAPKNNMNSLNTVGCKDGDHGDALL
jgi:hypothetical protein